MFRPLVCVVDFHHARGPEISHWFGAGDNDPTAENDWALIPYMALPDGAHQSTEEFSYFSLVHKGRAGEDVVPTSVFGISCTGLVESAELLFKEEDVTRSAVQKAVVAITDRPQGLGGLRERLRTVTRAWFAQRDFRDVDILERFQESLDMGETGREDERDQLFGLSLRELVRTFKWQTLILLKAMLLQPKMLFFGSNCERVCEIQFSLLSLIPGLIRNLQDCADPQMNRHAETLKRPDSVRTSDRSSLLAYMGIPLQLFGRGSIFGPYTPLQQLDTLTDLGTKSYLVGSTNTLLLQQRDRYCDLLVNLDDNSVTVISLALRGALSLTTADRRWIDFLTQAVNDTWDEADPTQPNTHGYVGSEEFIRLQFEEYLLAMLASVKYHIYLDSQSEGDRKALLSDVDGDPASDFGLHYVEAWQTTENYKFWQRMTDSHLFDIVEPRHPCAGGLTIEDVQRRLATQVAELHLDERFNQTREVVGKRFTDGRTQVTSAFNKVWADIEVMREAQRKRSEDARASAAAGAPSSSEKASPAGAASRMPDMQQAQATVAAAGQRAGAYLSSWGAWASEKRKTGWRSGSPQPVEQRSRGSVGGESARGEGDEGRRTSTRSLQDGDAATSTASTEATEEKK